jgi:nitrite reductase/ring-hydroxylating ferredoxin subunit
MVDFHICEISRFPKSGRKVVDLGVLEIGIFFLDGEFFAYENRCPHVGGPVCQGKVLPLALEDIKTDKTSDGRVFSKTRMNIVCPWHGFEFDIRTGIHPIDKRVRLRRIPVHIANGSVYVTVDKSPATRVREL